MTHCTAQAFGGCNCRAGCQSAAVRMEQDRQKRLAIFTARNRTLQNAVYGLSISFVLSVGLLWAAVSAERSMHDEDKRNQEISNQYARVLAKQEQRR